MKIHTINNYRKVVLLVVLLAVAFLFIACFFVVFVLLMVEKVLNLEE